MEQDSKKEKDKNRDISFLTNINNQSNIVNANNVSTEQINSVFILVSPYYINKFSLNGLDINLNIDEKGTVFINNKEYETVEIKHGVKMFGIIKRW